MTLGRVSAAVDAGEIMSLTSWIMAAALQAGAPATLNVALCNDTPFRAAFSIEHAAGPGRRVRRGWLTVPAGECLRGSIGPTTGREALAHARSGAWRWPADGARMCVPASTHDGPAALPPCPDSEREVAGQTVSLTAAGRGRTLEYRISCADLGPDAALCESSPTDAQGFAQPVKRLEICNRSGEAADVCREVYRGFPPNGRAAVNARIGGADLMASDGGPRFCPSGGAGPRTLPAAASGECPDGAAPLAFTQIAFRAQVSTFTYEIGRPR